MSIDEPVNENGHKPAPSRPAKRANILDWIFALGVSAVAIGGYVWLQTLHWQFVLFWTEWSFLTYAAVMTVLPTVTMMATGMRIWPRRFLVLIIGLAGNAFYLVVVTQISSQSIGLIREWREIRVPKRFSVEFPVGHEDDSRTFRGKYQGDLGNYQANNREFAAWHHATLRRYVFREVELLGRETPESEVMMDWLAKSTGWSNHREVNRFRLKMGDLPASHITTRPAPDKRGEGYQQILVVANGRRGYCLIVQSDDNLKGSPVVQRFFDSFKIIE